MFQKYAEEFWNEEERLEFISWLALNPEAGDVIPECGGCRKVRWSRAGTGKRGGVLVDNLSAGFLAKLKTEAEKNAI